MARLTQADLADLNTSFEQTSPQDLIRWARKTFHGRIAALTSMQRAGNVVCHMLYELKADMPVLFVDTGVLFHETLDTRDKLVERYGLNVVTLDPELTMEEQTAKYGVLYLDPEGQRKCCFMRKNEPLIRVADQYDAFISSLRRSDGGARSRVPVLSLDAETNSVRINPLVNFDDEQMERYITDNDIHINPLHSQGYATIGCNRCTTPVLPTEPKRAGRWRHLGPWSQYCGINPTDLLNPAEISIDLPLELIDRILGRSTDFMI
ncbi:MAG: phosphoadenylyl-sulfate reductase [Planctomycetaceae bacterium]|nr:phosphoadenylyl-sulfate reductase [Planctomycetaceae bacterium]